ncbi:RNA polymerase sigma factor [Parasphingorhabdus sp.]|uniref:RNA polymerase sigma factor n=1 Tax=Parasphingorhabdus sp. TaxID=2709688 RepID=UPI003264455D
MSARYSETDRIFDELLLTRLQAGDKRAAERLAARWHPRLMRTAFRLLRDEEQARVAVQESWTGICKGWRNMRDPSRFAAWAYRILHHKCADRIRHNRRDRLVHEERTDEPVIAAQAENRVALDQAFAQLSEDHRMAATLYFDAGLTVKEISDVTSCPLGTAKTRVFHARLQLKQLLAEDMKEGE